MEDRDAAQRQPRPGRRRVLLRSMAIPAHEAVGALHRRIGRDLPRPRASLDARAGRARQAQHGRAPSARVPPRSTSPEP